MVDIAELLKGLAAVAWPAIIVLLIFMFRPAFAALIESAKSRKFTLKIGGQELTMEEASGQQQKLIADLQEQVLEVKKRIEASVLPLPTEPTQMTTPDSTRSVLWVDDRPKNNSYFVQQLTDKGINVDLARSTLGGMRLFREKLYSVVISDMGRTEERVDKPTAGLDLLQQIRENNKIVPFIIFCSSRGARENREKALRLGATAITSSATELLGILQTIFGNRV